MLELSDVVLNGREIKDRLLNSLHAKTGAASSKLYSNSGIRFTSYSVGITVMLVGTSMIIFFGLKSWREWKALQRDNTQD